MKDDYEMSRDDMLRDPLVRQMMEADGVSVEELTALLVDVSMRNGLSGGIETADLHKKPLPCERATAFPIQLHYRLVFQTWH